MADLFGLARIPYVTQGNRINQVDVAGDQRGESFFAHHGGKSVFIGRFIPGVKAVVPGIAGMFGMDYRHFSIINVSSAFVWAAAHIVPGMLLSAWLKSLGLSLELVIIVGALYLATRVLESRRWR